MTSLGEALVASLAALGIAPIGVDLHIPDLVRIADAYGWAAIRLGDMGPLEAELHAALVRTGPSPIDIDEDLALRDRPRWNRVRR